MATAPAIAVPAAPAPAAPKAPRRRTARPARRPAPSGASWAELTFGYVRALPDHQLLDRIIRGRVWIPLLGVLLAGIVAMQVEVLKLNAAAAASLQQSTTLQNERDVLQANVARLADDQRIESMAAKMGMVMPAPADVKFLTEGKGTTNSAVGGIHAPDASTFSAQLPGTASGALAGSSVDTTPPATDSGAATTDDQSDTSSTGDASDTAGGDTTDTASGDTSDTDTTPVGG